MVESVCINLARIIPGTCGGMEAYSRHLCQKLLENIPEIRFHVYLPQGEWMDIVNPQEVDIFQERFWKHQHTSTSVWKGSGKPLHVRFLRKCERFLSARQRYRLHNFYNNRFSPQASEFKKIRNHLEAGDFQVIHCPYQGVWPPLPHAANRPYVIHLHDLQHEHFPDFFSEYEIEARRINYSKVAQRAAAIICAAEHVRRDIIHYCHVSEEKVFVAPWGPPDNAVFDLDEEDVAESRKRLNLPERFMFYPAALWVHKNHKRLFEAMTVLKSKGIALNLVMTGANNTSCAADLANLAKEMKIEEQIWNLGYVSYKDLQIIYQECDFLVIPSLYEATSGPLMEAMHMRKAVTAGKIADHEELVGDTVPLFDPYQVEDIAACVEKLATDTNYRNKLADQVGPQIHKVRSWVKFGNVFRSVYAYAAKQS